MAPPTSQPPPKAIRIKRAGPLRRQSSSHLECQWARETFGNDPRIDFELELAERAVAADEGEEEDAAEGSREGQEGPPIGGQRLLRPSTAPSYGAAPGSTQPGMVRDPCQQSIMRTRSGHGMPQSGETRRGSVVEGLARKDVEKAFASSSATAAAAAAASAADPTSTQTTSSPSTVAVGDDSVDPSTKTSDAVKIDAPGAKESRGALAALRRSSVPFLTRRESRDAAYLTPRFVEPPETTGASARAGSASPKSISPTRREGRLRSSSLALRDRSLEDDEHHSEAVVDYLDVVDPEVGALSYLTHFQNAVFVPNIPGLYDRRPVHRLPRPPTMAPLAPSARRGSAESALEEGEATGVSAGGGLNAVQEDGYAGGQAASRVPSRAPSTMLHRATSAVSFGFLKVGTKGEKHPDADKHIAQWSEMDEEERNELDEHIRHLLTKRSKFKRGARGFWVFVKTPMGFIMTFYGLSITVFGIAICLFLFGWVSVGDAGRNRFFIEIWDQILCALFAAIGIGFAPFRAVDTYRMWHIVKYHRLTYQRRAERHLPPLADPNDLPRPSMAFARLNDPTETELGRVDEEVGEGVAAVRPDQDGSLMSGSRGRQLTPAERLKQQREGTRISRTLAKVGWHKKPKAGHGEGSRRASDAVGEAEDQHPKARKKRSSLDSMASNFGAQDEIPVLSPEEQAELLYQQRKFHASHTYYRYTETPTHRAFPLSLAIAIVALLDAHSCLQATLGGCTWGIYYKDRPTALTATIITCSLSCNAVAGILIYIGGRKTKKREVVERRLRIALEGEAFARMERHRQRAAQGEARPEAATDGAEEDVRRGRTLAPVMENADVTPSREASRSRAA